MTQLKNSQGNTVYPQEGGSALVQFTLYDAESSQLNKAAILTLACTLTDVRTGQVINSRDGQSILDANGGSVGVDGDVDLILDPADNVIVTSGLSLEEHRIELVWTWLDSDANPYTGKESFLFSVQSADGATDSCGGWLG